MVDMGMDIGEPDFRLYARRNSILYILFLELKKKDGKLSQSQKTWNEDFDINFAASNTTRCVAYGFDEAKNIIVDWLNKL